MYIVYHCLCLHVSGLLYVRVYFYRSLASHCVFMRQLNYVQVL